MTPENAAQIANDILQRFSFHGALALLDIQCEVGPMLDGIRFQATLRVPDRNTGEPTRIYFSRSLSSVAVLHSEHILQTVIQNWLFDIWKHEFNEGLQFDGVRVRDPHKDRE